MSTSYYQQLSIQQRKEARRKIMNMLQNRRSQKEAIENGILKPINEAIESCYQVLKLSNGISFEEFQEKQKNVSKQMDGIFGGKK